VVPTVRGRRKLWALRSPALSAFSPEGEHPLDSAWLRDFRTNRSGATLYCEQRATDVLYVPPHWAHATLNLEEGLSVGGFLHDDASLSLHMQLLHAPRGVGSLQNAATLHSEWFAQVARAFRAL
jgi:hypothetical protein